MASSSSDFLHIVVGRQKRSIKVVKKDNITTNEECCTFPSLGNETTLSTSSSIDECNHKDKIVSTSSLIDILSYELSFLFHKNIVLIDNATKLMLNSNGQKSGGDRQLHDHTKGIRDLHDEAKTQTPSPTRRRTKDYHVSFYRLLAFSLSEDIFSSEIRNGKRLVGKKVRSFEKRGRLKTEISYYLPYSSQSKNDSSPLNRDSEHILGSKPIYLRVRRINLGDSQNSTTEYIPSIACSNLFRSQLFLIRDNRIRIVSSKSLVDNFLDTKILSTGKVSTSILFMVGTHISDAGVRDNEEKSSRAKNSHKNLYSACPKIKTIAWHKKYDILECNKQYEGHRRISYTEEKFTSEKPSDSSLKHVYQCLILTLFSLFVLTRLSLSILVQYLYIFPGNHQSSIFIHLENSYTRLASLYSVNILFSRFHPATNYCSSFSLYPKIKKTETQVIANLIVFKYATIVSIGRLPVALLESIQTVKPVLCYQLTYIWNIIRRHGVFNPTKMPNNIIRKSSISFNSSSYKSSTLSSFTKVHGTTMYLNKTNAFDTPLLWMLTLSLLTVVKGSNYRNDEPSLQLVYIPTEYSKFELPDKEEINPVQLEVLIKKKSSSIHNRFSKAIFEFVIVNWLENEMFIRSQRTRKQINVSEQPYHRNVATSLDLLNNLSLQNFVPTTIDFKSDKNSAGACVRENHKLFHSKRLRVIHERALPRERIQDSVQAGISRNENRLCKELERMLNRKVSIHNYNLKPYVIDLESHLHTQQLSNKNFVGAKKNAENFLLRGSEADVTKHNIKNDFTDYINNGISIIVSWVYLAMSYDVILSRMQFLSTLLLVYVDSLKRFAINMPIVKCHGQIKAWMISGFSVASGILIR